MSYLTHSSEIISSIDPAELGMMPLCEPAIGRGSGFSTHCLGEVAVLGEALPLAVKVPQDPSSTERRVTSDVALVTMLTDKLPSLTPLMPRFLGILAVEGKGGGAVITEDVSCGGKVDVTQTPLPEDIEAAIREAFGTDETGHDIFEQSALQRSLAFGVGGQIKLLDFTPPPFKPSFRRWAAYQEALRSSYDMMEAITITVSASSALAASLSRQS